MENKTFMQILTLMEKELGCKITELTKLYNIKLSFIKAFKYEDGEQGKLEISIGIEK